MPINDSAQVTQGLLTKSGDFTLDGTAAASLIQSGQFRVLAKFDDWAFLPAPNAPVIQSVLPSLDQITVWLGLVAPKGTPAPIVTEIQAEVVKALADPSIKPKADAAGLFPATSTPAEFGACIKKEAERWSKVVAESGMKYD